MPLPPAASSHNTRRKSVNLIASELSPEVVRTYLKNNSNFLESYVLSSAVSNETIKKWAAKKTQKTPQLKQRTSSQDSNGRSTGRTQRKHTDWNIENHVQRRKHLLDLSTDSEKNGANKSGLLYELTCACVQALDADGGHLYLTDKESQELFLYDSVSPSQGHLGRFRPSSGETVAAFTAKSLTSIRTADVERDNRFPAGTGIDRTSCQAVLCQPLIDTSGAFVGVAEFFRVRGAPPFTEKDEEIASLLVVWGCSAIYFSQLFHSMNKQRKQNDFLLNVAKSIFHDIVSMDTVIMKIMNFAQKLVNADRASLFLVDSKTNELYARIFDVGTGSDEHENLESQGAQREIRFPMDRGIAGHVATTGQILNIEDAYTDERFNREVDQKTGYTSKTILCMPIFIRGNVIGVVQMVNKQTGVFTKHDEEAFETFAIYCGLALHHAKLYDRIRRSEQKYRVALEVLAYHSMCNKDEIAKLKRNKLPDRVEPLESFDLHPLKLSEIQKPLYAVFMFKDLFKFESFDYDDLVRFVLTVRKNYRRVPYHNWTHGWSVAHAVYVILKSDTHFTNLERLAMFVGCLCHDLDHRGKNNAFMKNTSTPLAAIYSTSVMEHHHFNQTVTILQQDGHNIFKSLTSDEYKWVLGNIKHCILATDLALFFPNKAKLNKSLADETFSWDNKDNRLLVQAISMTACDLIASAKPWEVQYDTAQVIAEEFYEQGDAERATGKEPIPMMDRHKAHELPQMQVGFMKGICIPCYDVLAGAIPCVEALVEKSKYNMAKWQELADEHKQETNADK